MELLRDLRHSVRALVRAPAFAIVVILTLALGIGATTAIFSVVNAVILQPLGYPRPEQLVHISSQFPNQGFDQFWVSPPEFFELQERSRTFRAIAAFQIAQANLAAPDRPRRVTAARVSAELFAALDVQPLAGRWFEKSETLPNGAPVAILSHEVWRSAYGGDASLIGTAADISGVMRTIVGIMPPRFDLMDRHVEVWLPLVLDPANRQNRGNHFLYLIGRLNDGTSFDTANAELETLLAAWPASIARAADVTQGPHTLDTKAHRLRLDDLQSQIVGSAKTAVLVLQGAVVLVLLIACANVASLLLARAESRHREFAVRSALGAGKWQLLRGFMAEGLVLSVAGSTIGLALGLAGVRALIAAYPDGLPRSGEVTLDLGVLLFTLVVAVGSATVFGLAPLLHLAPAATSAALKEGGQRSTSGTRHGIRRALVSAEVALAVALVIGAGLLLRTVMNLTRVDSGFARGQLVTFGISLPAAKYTNGTQILSFYERLIADLRRLPGVTGVAAMSGLPPLRDVNANDTLIEGYVQPPGGPGHNVQFYQTVTTDYIEAMAIPVVEGRSFLGTDAIGSPAVLINETMANTFYKGQSPLGRRVRPSGGTPIWFTIVGVVKDVKQGGVDRTTGTEVYFNFEQLANLRPTTTPTTMNLIVRTALPADALAGQVHAAVSALDTTLPIVRLRAMDAVFEEAIGRPRLLASLLGLFAALAVSLAAIGSYGVLSYMVTERRREIGIRMALGAGRDAVLRMVLSQGLRLTIAGVVAGLAIAVAMNRLLATLLFGVGPSDPVTMAAVVGLMTGVAAIGCYLPARLATHVDPMIVLRED